jgi:hypothetical protein
MVAVRPQPQNPLASGIPKGDINNEEKNFASYGHRRALPDAYVVDVQ